MRSFASIATFATLAFASLASALPTLNANGVALSNRDVSGVAAPAPESLNVPHPGRGEPAQVAEHSVVQIIVDVTAEIRPLCDKLSAAISGDVEVKVAVDTSLQILGEIKGSLVKAKVDIEAAIAAGVDLLVLDGKTLAVHVVAQILAVLIVIVTTVLGLVVKVCASANVEALVSLMVEINFCLADIIGLVVKICVGLLVELKPLVECIVNILIKLDLKALIKVLAVVQA
ncbi:hypothetical protein AGABI1DRAFT_115011 [Agaricus bisporus var. burnettii JB137-S8]|uniref:Transmembrane protein n=2 Tax=Agaricus bisporus var. burnettii TaxID=192524 RepID=K5WQV5_AGABU|nr:uncharacterized protein AGABI1DRAFT_115011 [Agaricus bisporus var. burnettii JB137-S8]EKM77736.1 hypothetical protein AGABI1DRAFT_115011 [Agaricus bisporus var. burnettii JB137-S8]KAF7760187.1 hypothetical protein Agabi119p4_10863 [Agaricus bisporus var. burnettii]